MSPENRSQKNGKKNRLLSAPVMINLELTSGCNTKCRHCYNFWRDDSDRTDTKMSKERLGQIAKMVAQNKVFHVVLTGGEPFLNFDVLEYALHTFHAMGVSTSVNSNLMLATKEKMLRLKNTGLDHVLCSLNSHIPKINDYIFNKKGALERISQGIMNTVECGIRVSVNMIICELNYEHVYETAKLCSDLGVQKIFATRLVPSVNDKDGGQGRFNLSKDQAKIAIHGLLKANEHFGIAIGSLISYPPCLLGDLKKYKALVGRGCPAQRGNRMVINADGETHACTHEMVSYGNVFDIGIAEAFRKMEKWHDGSYQNVDCSGCDYRGVCTSGCRSAALSQFGSLSDKDPLMEGKEHIVNPLQLKMSPEILSAVDNREHFRVPEQIRFRKENGFYTINIRWANAYSIDSDLAEFLIDAQKAGRILTIEDFIGEFSRNVMLNLIYKEALLPDDISLRQILTARVAEGCSINPDDLTQCVSAGAD